jgi:ribonuclease HI
MDAPSPTLPAGYVIYTDGGARGNPGPAACGVLIFSAANQLLAQSGQFIGRATNNEAEYRAVLHALEILPAIMAPAGGPVSLEFRLDSLLVVQQLSGVFKLKNPRLLPLAAAVFAGLKKLKADARFVYVPRAQNHRADALVNRVLDAKTAAVR